jgi:hypothetical protein
VSRNNCAYMTRLAILLREKSIERNRLILRSPLDTNVTKVELDLLRINKAISRHRRQCPECKQCAFTLTSATRLGPLKAEHPSLSPQPLNHAVLRSSEMVYEMRDNYLPRERENRNKIRELSSSSPKHSTGFVRRGLQSIAD